MEEKIEPCSESEKVVAESEPAKQADKEVMSTKKLVVIMCSPILLPVAMMAVIMLGMFIGCGWLFVAMTFFGSAASAAVGICGIVGAFVNFSAGAGAVMLALGIGLIGLSLIYPVFLVAKEFCKGFWVLSKDVIAKAKDMKKNITLAWEKF